MKQRMKEALSVMILSSIILTGCNFLKSNNFTLNQVTSISNGHAAQGTAAYAGNLFICDKYGYCYMYTLKNGEFIAKFPLGSMDESDGPTQNHCNQMMFGPKKFDEADPYPLLYVTTGHSNDHDETGAYYGKCSIERIRYDETKGWYAEIVQTIEFNDEANIPDSDMDGTLNEMYKNGKFLYTSGNGYDASTGYQKMGYGWPHFYVDSAPIAETKGKLYIYSTRFRGAESYEKEAKEDYHITSFEEDNSYIFTSFNMPDLPKSESDKAYGETVTLYPKDIISQFETEYDTYYFQGGTMHSGRIYHAYGDGKQDEKYRDAILVFDVSKEEKIDKFELHTTKVAAWEPECCFFYEDILYVSAYNKNKFNQMVNIYRLEFENKKSGHGVP